MSGMDKNATDKFLCDVNNIREIDRDFTYRFLLGVNNIREIDKRATDRFLRNINNYLISVESKLRNFYSSFNEETT